MTEKSTNAGKIIGRFVARKSGNSLSLTIPAEVGVEAGEEFVLVAQDDGSLLYKYQHVNPWHTKAAKDYDFRADLDKMGNIFEEPRIGQEL
ncbi:AbrB/MazE/SpoVT family DNA-binding domain-containing protein [Lactiplantibacillus fabifermentans]|uniref:Uncharacterized protein n=2 Tax=Lactiplantibacillus fabifermentans TaxID=483011 RepID=A0A0R2NLK1_9LACO|nr:AbrB/MazE/SpoVT family DNA-binding domain-containing protein [Lactiplantibacillus fabifermentans]ETY73016.1 hypothetical protein LFAB_14565 [Lactiplantibacillus fabifermentans T30PCM01]KRO26613.1 hypothetical protein DY78_GL000794 [Lactiplantibacillus fabifermentans DSM 21115]